LVFLGRKRVSFTETQRRNSAGRVLRPLRRVFEA
jgi:hypothetical protein